eukprot:2794608-Rhodomonas_salina.1
MGTAVVQSYASNLHLVRSHLHPHIVLLAQTVTPCTPPSHHLSMSLLGHSSHGQDSPDHRTTYCWSPAGSGGDNAIVDSDVVPQTLNAKHCNCRQQQLASEPDGPPAASA